MGKELYCMHLSDWFDSTIETGRSIDKDTFSKALKMVAFEIF